MTKEEYYKKYKNNIIKKYKKYVLNIYKESYRDLFEHLSLFIGNLIFIILFPFPFIYHIIRRYYLRRKTWKRYVKGDESVLKLIQEELKKYEHNI